MQMVKIEKDFMVDNYRCVIVGTDMGHRCGYVGLSKGHRFYGMGYDDIPVDVHGGLTYAGGAEMGYPVPDSEDRW